MSAEPLDDAIEALERLIGALVIERQELRAAHAGHATAFVRADRPASSASAASFRGGRRRPRRPARCVRRETQVDGPLPPEDEPTGLLKTCLSEATVASSGSESLQT